MLISLFAFFKFYHVFKRNGSVQQVLFFLLIIKMSGRLAEIR